MEKGICIVVLLILFASVSFAKLKPISRTKQFNCVFKEILEQNNFFGFTIISRHYGKRIQCLRAVHDQILRSITKLSSVASTNQRVDVRKFTSSYIAYSNYDVRTARRVKNASLYVASGSGYLPVVLVTTDFLNSFNSLMAQFQTLVRMRIYSCTSKVLLICIYRKSNITDRQLENFLIMWFGEYYTDIEILVVPLTNLKSEDCLKLRVHNINYFKKEYQCNLFKRNSIQWFRLKTKNLHRYKIPIRKCDSIEGHINEQLSRVFTMQYAIKKLNGTYLVLLENDRRHFNKEFRRRMLFSTFYLNYAVKPLEVEAMKMIAPVIYDASTIYDYTDFIWCLFVIASIAFFIFLCVRMMRFDKQTWRYLTILEMIIGNGSARSPVLRSETVMFMLTITVGFFFGSNLTSGLTSIRFVKKAERSLQTLEDFKNNNITLILALDPKHRLLRNLEFSKLIVRSQINYKIYDAVECRSYFKIMILSKNISFSIDNFELLGMKFSEKLEVNKELVARISNLREHTSLSGWFMLKFRSVALRESLSDIYWRILETEGMIYPEVRQKKHRVLREKNLLHLLCEKPITEIEKDFDIDSLYSETEIHSLWAILVFGWICTCFLLLLELVTFKIQRTCKIFN